MGVVVMSTSKTHDNTSGIHDGTSGTPDQWPGGIARREFLTRAAAVGTGVLFGVAGGRLAATALAEGLHNAAAAADFSFVQITDTHIGAHSPANKDVAATFEAVVRRINALPQRPAFVIHTGDHVHLSKPAEFDTARQILNTIKAGAVYNTPGEHDVFLDQGKRYLQTFGYGSRQSLYYSFDYRGVHFLALANDSGLVGKGLGVLGAAQLAWIKQDLAPLSSETPLVLFSHVPLLDVYPKWGWATADSAQLLALVRRFSTVTALNGHIHQVVTRRAGNVVMHTANATSYPLHAPGQVAPTPLVLPAAALRKRIGLRDVSVAGAMAPLSIQDQTLA